VCSLSEAFDKIKEKDFELITEIIDFINEFRKNKTAEKKDLIHINKLIEAFWDKNIKQE
jgi:flagellar basal body P-ring protein FlgI